MPDVTDSAHLGAPVASDPPTVYVFGAFNGPGHYIRAADGRLAGARIPASVDREADALPRRPSWQEPDPQAEGTLAHAFRLDGWSGVTWWDRQGDSRRNSHTGLLAFGDFTPAELIALGRQQAPWAFRVDVRVGGAP